MHCFLFIIRFLLVMSCLFPMTSFALKSDQEQTAYVKADSAVLNYKTGICQYQGHVKFTQGTTAVTANLVITYTDKHNKVQEAIATGSPASYSTLPDKNKIPFVATAETIKYYPQKGYVKFITNAQATQGKDKFAGNQLNYDIKQQIVSSPASHQERTSIVIQPDQKE
jgi:lipopolysaccharide export system protein LptA